MNHSSSSLCVHPGNVVWQDPVTAARALLQLSHSRKEVEEGLVKRKNTQEGKKTDQQMEVDEKDKGTKETGRCQVVVCSLCVGHLV